MLSLFNSKCVYILIPPPPAPSPLRHVHSNASQSNFTTVSTWHRLLKTTQMLSSRHGSCTRWKFFHSHTPAPAHYIENIAGRLDDHLCIYKMVEVSGQKVRHVVHFSTNWMYHSISVDMEVYLPKDKSVKLSVLHACSPILVWISLCQCSCNYIHTHTLALSKRSKNFSISSIEFAAANFSMASFRRIVLYIISSSSSYYTRIRAYRCAIDLNLIYCFCWFVCCGIPVGHVFIRGQLYSLCYP